MKIASLILARQTKNIREQYASTNKNYSILLLINSSQSNSFKNILVILHQNYQNASNSISHLNSCMRFFHIFYNQGLYPVRTIKIYEMVRTKLEPSISKINDQDLLRLKNSRNLNEEQSGNFFKSRFGYIVHIVHIVLIIQFTQLNLKFKNNFVSSNGSHMYSSYS